MDAEIKDNELILLIEKDIYNEDVLHKCFYWYGGNFDVDISSYSEGIFSVRLKPTSETQDLNITVERIRRDLIDFKLRDIVTKETKTIRELIVAKAFAYYGLDDNPITEVSDPVGFNPVKIKSSATINGHQE